MEFIKKTELFFIQLQYCLTIEPEPILQAEKGVYNLMLKPDIFFKLINDFNIDYPFIPENKIIELKGLMSKENINTKNALKIIENYKKQYWFLDTVVMFEPVTDKLKRTLKSIDINISEKEINIELINYQKHLQAKRESIYIDLINEMQSLPPQPIKTKQPTEEKTLSDLITHQKSVEIVEGIKIQYKNIKGKRLKLLLLALQELNLLPNERIAQKFYDCCKAEFGWDVATYPAMNDYKFNEYTDKIELDNMKKFLEEIIQTK